MNLRTSRLSILCAFLTFFLFITQSLAVGTWVPLTNPAPSGSGGVMILLSDGTVLCKSWAGGPGYGHNWNRLTPDIHGSYVNGTWTTIDTMFDTRLYFATQLLKDGRLYVAGGEYGSGGPTVATFNPVTGHWTPAPAMTGGDGMIDGPSEILPDGNVLQYYFPAAGGPACKIFVTASNIFFPGPAPLSSADETTWLKLPDNSIIYANHDRTSERYIPALNTWVADDSIPVSLYDGFDFETGPAFVLPDGRAFFTGSPGTTAFYTPSGTASPGVWTAGPYFPGSQGVPDAAGAMMTNGKILVAVSFVPYGYGVYPSPTAFFEFDYLTNIFTPVDAPMGGISISEPCYYTNMLNLPDGNVLFCSQTTSQYYEYIPDSPPLAIGKPTIDSIYRIACDTCKITGSLFNGITEGASYGDDWQMASNYPIVRLLASGDVYYAFSFKWNSTGIMRFGLHDTAYFVLPAALPDGTYNLEVVANGNPSNPHPFTTCLIALDTKEEEAIDDNSLTVYPNPADKYANISFHSNTGGKYRIKLMNILGGIVSDQTVDAIPGKNVHVLHLDKVAKGLYNVVVTDGSDVYTARLLVE